MQCFSKCAVYEDVVPRSLWLGADSRGHGGAEYDVSDRDHVGWYWPW
jgi:hypothetical protein